MQTEKDKTKFKPIYKDGGIINCSKYIYKHKGGLLGFWKGYGVCTLRAFWANSFMFYGFESSKEYLTRLLED